jgi:hypothetical protein
VGFCITCLNYLIKEKKLSIFIKIKLNTNLKY